MNAREHLEYVIKLSIKSVQFWEEKVQQAEVEDKSNPEWIALCKRNLEREREWLSRDKKKLEKFHSPLQG